MELELNQQMNNQCLSELTEKFSDIDFMKKVREIADTTPDFMWTTHHRRVRTSTGIQYCIYGLIDLYDRDPNSFLASNAAVRLQTIAKSNLMGSHLSNSSCYIADANNGDHPDYKQETPKLRTLAILDDTIEIMEKQKLELLN